VVVQYLGPTRTLVQVWCQNTCHQQNLTDSSFGLVILYIEQCLQNPTFLFVKLLYVRTKRNVGFCKHCSMYSIISKISIFGYVTVIGFNI